MLESLPKIDGSIPAQAQLNPGEELIASQSGVGLYDNGQKAANYQSGSIHVTSHRLLFISDDHNTDSSLALQLALVSQSEHYGGFLTSSSKVELILHSATDEDDYGLDDGWTCEVCAHSNAASLGPRRVKCTLCGSPRPLLQASSRPSTAMGTNLTCPACTFINTPGKTTCEICETPLPPTRSNTPKPPTVPTDRQAIKISFRKGGDRPLYAAMKRALQAKAWASEDTTVVSQTSAPSQSHVVGISGVLSTVESNAAQSTDTVSNALRDLEALTAQAKSMVAMASTLATKLQQQQTLSSSPTPGSTPLQEVNDSVSFVQRSLFNMGLALPDGPAVQAAASEQQWIDELSDEIASLLRDGLMGGRGMVALDEIWCSWNRARGMALLSPAVFQNALNRTVERRLVGISTRRLTSGLIVLHTPELSHAAFTQRLLSASPPHPPVSDVPEDGNSVEQIDAQVWHTALSVADKEGVAYSLAVQLLEAVEDDGAIWRDEVPASGMVRWTKNSLNGYVWDGD